MYCIVVKRGSFQSYDLLHEAFGQKLPIVWDQRQRERRHVAGSLAIPDRRHAQRRGPEPASWMALGFVVVRR
jgi:hypothetical protein